MNLPKNLLSRLDFAMCHEVNTQKVLILLPWFKKGSGTFAGTAQRVLGTKVPDPFLNHLMIRKKRASEEENHQEKKIEKTTSI